MIPKMADKVKMVQKHIESVSQTNQRIRSLQAKIEYLDKWRSMENNVLSSLLVIKIYDISLHTFATSECQDSTFIFEENATQNPLGMMELYDKSIYDIQRYI